MKRLLALFAITAAAAAFGPVSTAAAADSCSIETIAAPTIALTPAAVTDRMVGKCFTTVGSGYEMSMVIQYESGGVWNYQGDNALSQVFLSGVEGSLQNTWPWNGVAAVCSYNWRGIGTWIDANNGDYIGQKTSAVTAKTC